MARRYSHQTQAIQSTTMTDIHEWLKNVHHYSYIPVNTNPNSQEIKEIVDLRRIGPYRRTFYLAKSIDGNYYWFHAPRAERDHQLRELIRDHRHQSHANDDHKGTSSVKTLRSRKIIMT